MSSDNKELLTIIDFRAQFARALSIQTALLLAGGSKEAEDDLSRFTMHVAASCRPNQFFEAKALGSLTRTVFENPNVRDFVLDLDARFFLSLNEDGGLEQSTQLARLLANTGFVNNSAARGSDKSIVPAAVLSAYTRADHNTSFALNMAMLQTDRWLMTILLMHLEVTEQAAEKQMKELVVTAGKTAGRK